MGKEQSFQQAVLEKLNIHVQKNEGVFLPHTINKKINLKWIKDINVDPNIMKIWKEGEHHDIGFGGGFSDIQRCRQKGQQTKLYENLKMLFIRRVINGIKKRPPGKKHLWIICLIRN